MKIYVAHNYGRRRGLTKEEREANVAASVELGRQIILKGHIPFIPNLYHHIHEGWDKSPNEEVWTRMVSAWIEDCQALLVGSDTLEHPDWEHSGVRREIGIARRLNKIIYLHIDEVPDLSIG